MTSKLLEQKKKYFTLLDKKACFITKNTIVGKHVTKLLLKYIHELYLAAQAEKEYSGDTFNSAYHQPVTSDLEFIIARIFYHYSRERKLNWNIFLRNQITNTITKQVIAPDIRIEKDERIVAIIEIKAKAGWMQPFFSEKRKQHDIELKRNPLLQIKNSREQLMKYAQFKNCGKERVFLLLPSFCHVHRNKYKDSIVNYRNTFAKNSTLNKNNLILLSGNPSLNLATKNEYCDFAPTKDFEIFIKRLKRL